MNTKEAIERIKARFDKWALDNEDTEAIQTLIPELAESEDERIRKALIEVFKKKLEKGFEWVEYGIPNRSVLDWLEKQKEQKPAQYDLDVLEKHITKDSISELAHTVMIRNGWDVVEQEQKPEEKPINWNELTWKDINELEGIINNVHYEFRNGIGQESFGKEVLEQFREYKGDEYLDGIEEKPVEWSEDIIRKAVREVGLTQHQIDWFKTNVFPPKQEWIEEDIQKIRSEEYTKGFNDAAFGKSKEWSVEDEEMFFFINELMENKGRDYFTTLVYDAVQNWLKNRFKSLRPKKNISYGELPLVSIDYVEGLDTDFEKQVGAVIASAMNREHQFTSEYVKWAAQQLMESAKDKLCIKPRWKPSKEHFQGLRRAITKAEKGSYAWNSLTDLYEQLKKL